MNRRSFVGGTSAYLLAGASLGKAFGQSRASECALPPAGVQSYTVRDLLQRDAATALAALNARGFQELELIGLDADTPSLFGLPLQEFKTLADAHGLRLPSSHIGDALTSTGTVGERARRLGVRSLFVALPREFTATAADGRFELVGAESREQLDGLAERLNRAGREFQAQGLTFGYHNHHVEFLPVDGETAFDYLMRHTDPAVVKLELDVGWTALAGVDVVGYLSRYADRVVACHLKDCTPAASRNAEQEPQTQLVEPGGGIVDFAAVLAKMNEIGVAHGFIEIDVVEDPLAAVYRGLRYLQTVCR